MGHLLSINSYHYRRGGADSVYLDHAELMERNGWYNRFFSMEHPRNEPCRDSSSFASMVDHEFADTVRAKITSGFRTVYNKQAALRLSRMIQSALVDGVKFDVAHLHGIYHHLTPAIIPVLKRYGIRTIITAHDLKLACPAYKMMNSSGICEECKGGNLLNVVRHRCIKNSTTMSTLVWIEAELHRALGSYRKNLDAIIAPSKFYRQKLIEWGWESKRVHYVPNFVNPIHSSFSSDYSGNVIYFGRLSSEKGLTTLIRAAALSGVSVDIVGDGPYATSLKNLADSICSPVKFHGRLDGEQLWRAVGGARAVVLPSEWYENAPLSVLEAFQLRRPAIGARIGGIPELIETPHGQAGWLFKSGDVVELAETLSIVNSRHADDLRGFGEIGKLHTLTSFSEQAYYSAISNVYNAP